jgi:predicted transcriptional regulator
MGIQEDINWLKDDPDRIAVFRSLARLGTATIRSIKEDMRIDDWWPVKYHVTNLVNRGLVGNKDGSYELTETGKKVYEGVKFLGEEIKPV